MGIGARLEAATVNDPIVLCYHALSSTWEASMSTTPERFERQIALLARRGYRGTTFTRALDSRAGERLAVITFDDAYRSVLELARPILDRFEMPATVFVPTAGVEAGRPLCWAGIDHWSGGPHESELTPMSWEDLRTLAGAGWEIGSHTVTHPHLTAVDDATLEQELKRSKADCEAHVNAPCTSLAYPYGDVDARVVGAAERAGYVAGAALPRRLAQRSRLAWPRIGIYRIDDDVRFRLKVSPWIVRLRRRPVWDAVSAARRLLV
jgi:peptidoglycan/xylan/chitin deacetylase (PgdA/CDA1 family)